MRNRNSEFRARAQECVESGAWMVRADTDGVSHDGFRWSAQGEWTEAPDWLPTPKCGHGLHGQSAECGGMIHGSRLVFCEIDPTEVVKLGDKIKVRRAKILLIDELPKGIKAECISLRGCTGLTSVEGLEATERIDLHGCTGLTSVEGIKAERIDLHGCTGLTSVEGLEAAKWISLSECTGLTSVEGLKAKWIDLHGCTGLTSVEGLKAKWISLSGCTGLTSVEGLKATKWIDLSGCTGLTSVEGIKAKRVIK